MAIAMVLASHMEGSLPPGYLRWILPFREFLNRDYGVQIFFVLSGYLITTILIREFDAIGKLDIKAFYCRRILRIFPAFYLYLLFVALLAWIGRAQISGINFAFATAHLINYKAALVLLFHLHDAPSRNYWLVGHFWSLSMEEQFYWMWPLGLLFLLRTRGYGFLAALVFIIPLIRVASYYLCPGLRGQLMLMLHTGADAIAWGCLLAVGLARYPELSRKLLISPVAIAWLALYVYGIDPLIAHFGPRGYGIVLGTTLVVGAVTVVMANVLLQDGNTWYHRLLENRALVFLGRISYSVYLWQQVFFSSVNTTFFAIWPLNIVGAILAGWLSYRLVELPFIRLKDKYFPPHTKAASSAQPAAG